MHHMSQRPYTKNCYIRNTPLKIIFALVQYPPFSKTNNDTYGCDLLGVSGTQQPI